MPLLSSGTSSAGPLLTFNEKILVCSASSHSLLVKGLSESPLNGIGFDRGDPTAACVWILMLVDELDVLTVARVEALLLGIVSGVLVEAGDHSVFVGEVDNLSQLTLQVTRANVMSIDSPHVFIGLQLDNLILLSPCSTGGAVVRVLSLTLKVGDLELVDSVSSLAFNFTDVLAIDAAGLVGWILDVAWWTCLAPS